MSKAQLVMLVLFATLCVAIGESLLSAGMKTVGKGDHTGIKFAVAAITNWKVVVGTALMATFFGLYAFALSQADISFVLPITASSYLLVAIIAHLALGETVTLTRWIGAAVITVGVVIVAKGS